MRWLVLLLIRVYQRSLSPLSGPTCRYEPSCSQYTYEAVQAYGAVRGGWLGARRIWRCRPGVRGGYDPVPDAPPPDAEGRQAAFVESSDQRGGDEAVGVARVRNRVKDGRRAGGA